SLVTLQSAHNNASLQKEGRDEPVRLVLGCMVVDLASVVVSQQAHRTPGESWLVDLAHAADHARRRAAGDRLDAMARAAARSASVPRSLVLDRPGADRRRPSSAPPWRWTSGSACSPS